MAARFSGVDAVWNGDTNQRRFLAQNNGVTLYLRGASMDWRRFSLGILRSAKSASRGGRRIAWKRKSRHGHGCVSDWPLKWDARKPPESVGIPGLTLYKSCCLKRGGNVKLCGLRLPNNFHGAMCSCADRRS